MTLLPSTLEWMEYAEHDFLTAKILLDASQKPFEIIAYHCQQCAEKYQKAVLIQNKIPVPFIHDLQKLNMAVQSLSPKLKELEPTCELLTPFGTAARYPGSAMSIGPEHMTSVVTWTESIRSAIRAYFNE